MNRGQSTLRSVPRDRVVREWTGDTFLAPATPLQRHRWRAGGRRGRSPEDVAVAVELTGAVRPAAVRQAVAHLVARHEPLRTTFREVNGEPWQVVARRADPPLELADFRALPGEDGQVAAADHLLDAIRRPFDLGTGPLLRVHLLLVEDEWSILLIHAHGAIVDGSAVGLLRNELLTTYAAAAAGVPADPPEPAVQLVDVATDHAGAATELAGQLAYWCDRLAEPPPALELPADAAPRPGSGGGAGTVTTQLAEPATRRLAALAHRHGATPFVVVLAVLGVLLRRHSGRTDLVVGSSGTVRMQPGLAGLVGPLDNPLALRLDLAGDPTFEELLARVRDSVREAEAYRDVPYEQVREAVRASWPEPDPLFRVALDCSPAPGPPPVPGLVATPLDLPAGASATDLRFTMAEAATGLSLSLAFNGELVSPESADHLLERMRSLLVAAVADPTRRIDGLVGPGSDADHPGAEPGTPVERAIAAAWRETLGVERLGVDSDFFALGGDSFQVVRVITELQRNLGLEVPVRFLFEQPTTIAGLASRVELLQWNTRVQTAPAVRTGPREEGEL